MSSEAWAIVGVVVGALLGGVGQLVADVFQQLHEKRLASRSDRREAYTEFLAAATEALSPVAQSQTELDRNILPKTLLPESTIKVLDSAQGALNRLSTAAMRVYLVAPEDTYQAVMDVQAALMSFMFKDEEGMAERLAKAHGEFGKLAKRDLAG